MRAADERVNASIITHSSIRWASTGVQVGCTTKTSVPRMFSSIWNETSPSVKRRRLARPSGTSRTCAISAASVGCALPANSFRSPLCVGTIPHSSRDAAPRRLGASPATAIGGAFLRWSDLRRPPPDPDPRPARARARRQDRPALGAHRGPFGTAGRGWLGRKDSNLRIPDPKSGALPLGHAPSAPRGIRGYARGRAQSPVAGLSAIGDISRCSGPSQGRPPASAPDREPRAPGELLRPDGAVSRVPQPTLRTAARAASAASRARKSPNTAEPLPDMAAWTAP